MPRKGAGKTARAFGSRKQPRSPDFSSYRKSVLRTDRGNHGGPGSGEFLFPFQHRHVLRSRLRAMDATRVFEAFQTKEDFIIRPTSF
jgi:hypothetical protein